VIVLGQPPRHSCQGSFLLLRENADCLHALLLIGNMKVPRYMQI